MPWDSSSASNDSRRAALSSMTCRTGSRILSTRKSLRQDRFCRFQSLGIVVGIDVPQNAHGEITAARLEFLKIQCRWVELRDDHGSRPRPSQKGSGTELEWR